MVISKEKHLQNIKKYWSKEEKNNFFQAWKESKLSQSEFCRQNNLSTATFSNWVSQFKKNSKPKLLFSPIQAHKAINNPQSKNRTTQWIAVKFS
jgi:transposase-like protein